MSTIVEEGQVRISKRGAARVRNGHLWVYRSDILEVKDVPAGAIISVRTNTILSSARRLQCAIADRTSVPRTRKYADRRGFLRKRFQEADDLRSRLGVDPQLSRRIYSEGDLLPGLIVDRYGDYLVRSKSHPGSDRLQPLFVSILAGSLSAPLHPFSK